MMEITVCKSGNGDFTTIQDAINAIRVHPLEPVTVHIKNGKYREKLVIPDNKPNIRLIGESAEQTIISGCLYAQMRDAENQPLGTFRTPTVTVTADEFVMENITVENTAGYGPEIGQALALYLSGDRAFIKNVRLLGYQDTFYSSKGRQYFLHCYIEGHVDFIFGSGTAVFDQCEIHSLHMGYITAASTPEDKQYGFIFFDCKLTGVAEERSVYLGRPWRPHAQTAFIRTWMGPHIRFEGWNNWRNPQNERTARYAEYQSTGPGSAYDLRVNWSSQISESELEDFTLEKIFGQTDDWPVTLIKQH
ncbi:pectinesterase family protein [Bacillus sp. AK128]